MKPAVPGQVCQGCGKDPAAYQPESHHYPAGQLLAGRYYVGAALGEGGFGITYLGLDTKLERRVAIKEYFPRTLVRRESSSTLNVTCYTGSDSYFQKGREQFLREAQTLAKLDDVPEIVHVLDFFAENNSAYIVMEFLEGTTLKALVTQHGFLPAKELFDMLEPVLKGMDSMHKDGLIHRDISPDNLMLLKKSGHVKLMDFGCAREIGIGHTMTIMLKPGFAPAEQYTGHEQGPWTDVYAMSATMYYCLTGKVPPEAMHRMGSDTLIPPSQLGMGISAMQEKALLKGLAVEAKDHWRSAAELYTALYGKTPAGIPVPDPFAVAATPAVKKTAPVEVPKVAPATAGKTEYILPSSVAYTEYAKPEAPKKEKKSFFLLPLWHKALSLWQKLLQLPTRTKAIAAGSVAALLLLSGFGIFWLTHSHRFGDWVTVEAPSCIATGLQERKYFCGKAETEVLVTVSHTPVTDPAVAATCAATGLTQGSHCSVCNAVLVRQQATSMLSHTIVTLEAVAPTCTETGLTEGVGGSACDHVETEQAVIDALGHSEVTDAAVAATCTTEGKTKGSHCSRCGEVLIPQETIAKLAHTPVANSEVAATCTAEGSTGGTHCSVCGAVIVAPKTVAKLAHTPVTDPAVAATCSEEGKTEGSHCSVCGKTIVSQQSIETTSHTYVWYEDIEPTCIREGREGGAYCSVCNEILFSPKVLEKTNHGWGKAYTCVNCGLEGWEIDVSVSVRFASYSRDPIIDVQAKFYCNTDPTYLGSSAFDPKADVYDPNGQIILNSYQPGCFWQKDGDGFSFSIWLDNDDYVKGTYTIVIRESENYFEKRFYFDITS